VETIHIFSKISSPKRTNIAIILTLFYGKSSKILAGKGEKAELYLNDSPRRSQSKPCAYSMIAVLEKPIMGLLNHFRTQPGMKYDTMLSLFLSSKKQAKAQSQGNGSLSGFVTLGKRKRE